MRLYNDGPVKFSSVDGQLLRTQIMRSIQSGGHDSHGLLRVITAVAEAVRRRREELQLAKPRVNSSWGFVSQQPIDGNHERQAQDESHDWRDHNENQGFVPALGNNHMPSGSHNRRAGVATN